MRIFDKILYTFIGTIKKPRMIEEAVQDAGTAIPYELFAKLWNKFNNIIDNILDELLLKLWRLV